VVESPELGELLVRHAGAGIPGNYAAMPRWPSDGWRDSLARVVEHARDAGEWPSLLIADRLDRPIGLGDALAREGWRAVGHETVLWVGRASVIAHLDPRMRIEAVRPRAVETHEAIEREIFGLSAETAARRRASLAAALETGRLRAFVVRVDDEPVAVARVSVGPATAGLYGIGVRASWRGKGYGTLLTTVATRAGMALGKRLVWLSVEDENTGARRVYERLGFAEAFAWARWLAPGRLSDDLQDRS
jgi:ribosomal protein S18 acetylase RimI-like enzyme